MFSCGRNGELLRHKSSVHLKMKPYKCVHCDFSFGWEGNLQKHIKIAHEREKEQKCLPSFASNPKMNRHILKKHAEIEMKTDKKVQKVEDRNAVTKYKKERPFQCDICNARFKTKATLTEHNKHVHLKIRKFQCDFEDCLYSCTRKDKLHKHKSSVHLKLKPYKCVHCDSSFGFTGDFQRHIKTVHERKRGV